MLVSNKKPFVEILKPNVSRWEIKNVSGWEDGAFINGISAVMKETPENNLNLFTI